MLYLYHMKRRQFLTAVLGLASAPLALRAAGSNLPTTVLPQPIPCGTPLPPPLPPSQRAYQIEGLAIKVPSNRFLAHDIEATRRDGFWPHHYSYCYAGNWDGTFKLERGCTNPAFILADLIEKTGQLGKGDWVTHYRVWRDDGTDYSVLNWQMLLDWGMWCDEPKATWSESGYCNKSESPQSDGRWVAQLDACRFISTRTQADELRETLRMHCLRWQSTDPRYRTSWPGVPYSEASA